MGFSLIVCTYMRPQALLSLLESVKEQTTYPDEILIIDGSINDETKRILETHITNHLNYFQVDKTHRGLTKQRNFGISKVSPTNEIVCFLDDDTILHSDYFKEVIKTFQSDKDIIGVGGVATNENRWKKADRNLNYSKHNHYQLDGYVVEEGLRNRLRNYLHLQSPLLPSQMPEFSHGRTCSYPLNSKVYDVDLLVGMSFSFRASLFKFIQFSTYFEGYGLYEDADFCIRAQKYGKNVIVTKAQLEHHHDALGRPNMFKYGKMVIRNGWYVWRIKYPNPSLIGKFKWYAIHLLLISIRFVNVLTTTKRRESLTDAFGRIAGCWSLLLKKPSLQAHI